MENFNELLEKLNGLKIVQKTPDWAENIPFEIWNSEFDGKSREVKFGLDVDTRRWYETSITVVHLNGKFMGVRHISNVFSESMGYEDCGFTLQFFEMKEVQVTSYEKV